MSSNHLNSRIMENNLAPLQHIRKVEAPPFLWTRIQQRISNEKDNRFSPTLSWALSIAIAVIFLVNGVAFANSYIESKRETNLLQSMNLLPHNSLYK